MRVGGHEEGIGSPGARAIDSCERLIRMLGTELGSPTRAARTLNFQAMHLSFIDNSAEN